MFVVDLQRKEGFWKYNPQRVAKAGSQTPRKYLRQALINELKLSTGSRIWNEQSISTASCTYLTLCTDIFSTKNFMQ